MITTTLQNLIPDLGAFSTNNGNGKTSMFGEFNFMKTINNLTGLKFKGLLVTEMAKERNGRGRVLWICKCDCGNICQKTERELRYSKSCGCLTPERLKAKNRTHGKSETSEYNIWSAMKRRCSSDVPVCAKDYKERGITVCSRWRDSFESFYADMGDRPSKNHSIDRIDNDMNYSCGKCEECISNGWLKNVKWDIPPVQTRNKRNNVWIEYNGMRMVQEDWAKYLKADKQNLARMLKTKSFEYCYNHYMFNRRKSPIKK